MPTALFILPELIILRLVSHRPGKRWTRRYRWRRKAVKRTSPPQPLPIIVSATTKPRLLNSPLLAVACPMIHLFSSSLVSLHDDRANGSNAFKMLRAPQSSIRGTTRCCRCFLPLIGFCAATPIWRGHWIERSQFRLARQLRESR